jgi:prepilin-type N-terminal cleavage/methylation domain-containing protein
MKNKLNTSRAQMGFSLAEMLVAMTIAAMVLAAVLGIYSRAENATTAVQLKLDSSRLPAEVLQLITEDLDRIAAPGSNAKITIENRFDNGFQTARLTINNTIYDAKNKERTFEEIVWQATYDYDTNVNGLILYRSHAGIALEDKLLDQQRQNWERNYPFVPICNGLTFFQIRIPRGESFQDNWTGTSLPPAVTVTVSFAQPYETVRGTLEVPDEDKITRTVAVDRTRKIRFQVLPAQDNQTKSND